MYRKTQPTSQHLNIYQSITNLLVLYTREEETIILMYKDILSLVHYEIMAKRLRERERESQSVSQETLG